MIHISFGELENGTLVLAMDGHSGAAEPGEDLICAAATILAYTLAQNVQDAYLNKMLRRKPKIALKQGEATITAKPLKDYRTEVYHAFFVVQRGFEVLAGNYPENVKVETF